MLILKKINLKIPTCYVFIPETKSNSCNKMWREIILQISCIDFTLLLMLNVIYFTICHDSVIYLPLFYIQLWQEEPIRRVKLSASAENLARLFLFLSFTDSLSRHIFPQVPLRLFSISLSFFSFSSLRELCFNCSDNLWTDSCSS